MDAKPYSQSEIILAVFLLRVMAVFAAIGALFGRTKLGAGVGFTVFVAIALILILAVAVEGRFLHHGYGS